MGSDFLIDFLLSELNTLKNSVTNLNRPGTAVCLHNQSLKTQKRSSAVLTCIKCLHGFFDGRFHQKSSNLAAGVFHKAGFKHLHKGTSKSFIKLQEMCIRDRDMAYLLYEEKGMIQTGEFRDRLGISRKCAIILLERFDRERITVMENGGRVLKRNLQQADRSQ